MLAFYRRHTQILLKRNVYLIIYLQTVEREQRGRMSMPPFVQFF